MWDTRLLLFQSHETALPLFHFQLIRPRYLLFLGQLFYSEYKETSGRRVLVISSAWKHHSYLLPSGFTSPGSVAGHGNKKQEIKETVERKAEEAEPDRCPLITAVKAHCVWEKVVIEVGASPLKSEAEWLSENNDSYDEGSVRSLRGQRWSCGRGKSSLLWRHWSNVVFSVVMRCTEGPDKDIAFGLSYWERKKTSNEKKKRMASWMVCAFKILKNIPLPLRNFQFLSIPAPVFPSYTITTIKQSFFLLLFSPQSRCAESVLVKTFFQSKSSRLPWSKSQNLAI